MALEDAIFRAGRRLMLYALVPDRRRPDAAGAGLGDGGRADPGGRRQRQPGELAGGRRAVRDAEPGHPQPPPAGLRHQRDQERQPHRAGARGGGLRHALRHPAALPQGGQRPAAAGAAGGAALRPLRHPAARHGARAAARARRLHHRLGQCARCRHLARPLRLRRICRAPHHLPRGDGAGRARRRRLPALRAGAGGRRADGRGRPSRPAAQHDPDGRPDRCARQPDQGQRARHRQADRMVRAQPDQPRAAALSRRRRGASIPASCSSPPS